MLGLDGGVPAVTLFVDGYHIPSPTDSAPYGLPMTSVSTGKGRNGFATPVGDLEFIGESLDVSSTPGLTMLAYAVEPG